MERYLSAAVACVFGVAIAANASALTITQSASVSTQPTNWTDNSSLGFNTFDTGIGILDSVVLSLTGTVVGDLKAESRDASPSTITLTLSALIDVQRPDASSILDVAPSTSKTFNASAFDGLIDFGGTSGVTFSGLSATATTTLTDLSDLSLFSTSGPGTITLLGAAQAASTGSGAGNLITEFSTQAGADLEIAYNYHLDPPAPLSEPGNLIVFIPGLIGIGVTRRKRRGHSPILHMVAPSV